MKKYQIIYADPPWKMKKIERKVRPNQVGFDYPVMGIEDIKRLSIPSANDAVCFLWTTQTYLPFAFSVLEAWGFSYHVTITWDKMNGMTLRGFHRRTEFLLVGYKGKMIPKMFVQGKKAFPTIFQISSKKLRHSEKPNEIRDFIVANVGDLPRIELFARQKTDGWDVWGDEVNSDINL